MILYYVHPAPKISCFTPQVTIFTIQVKQPLINVQYIQLDFNYLTKNAINLGQNVIKFLLHDLISRKNVCSSQVHRILTKAQQLQHNITQLIYHSNNSSYAPRIDFILMLFLNMEANFFYCVLKEF